jgi:hypothetical protein
MDGRVDETSHSISLCRFESTPRANRRYKEQKLTEIIIAICALLNSDGGNVVLHNECNCKKCKSSQMSLVVRILEQSMISIIGLNWTVSNINFKEDKESIVILVKKTDSLITTNYNLYLPSESQVVQVPPLEPLENVKHDIINRKAVSESVQSGSHQRLFCKGKKCDFDENKMCELKHLKAGPTKRTTLADRMTGKGNKFSCYVSAFANYRGGHIYYGIRDDGVVEGELISNEEDISEIAKKVGKAINKMIWPEQIGQPKRGEHWEIFFEPVEDENSKPIPSTFVIVIYIAACLGGVFTEEPECYEMVEGEVKKLSLTTWKKAILHPGRLRSREEIPRSVQRISWSTAKVRKAFTVEGEKLRQLINDGDWDAFLKECSQTLQRKSQSCVMKLLVWSKQVIACCRRGRFQEAHTFLEQYNTTLLLQTQDRLFFEVMGLYLQAALKRASGDFQELPGLLTEALSKADLIETGLVTAIVYVFAGTVTDLINSEDPTKVLSPDVLSIRALEHLRCVPDHSKVLDNMKQKVRVTLATFYLGCNISGQRIKDNIDISSLDKAKTSTMAIYQSVCEGNPLSGYREVQLKLVLSIYNYRQSQVYPDERVRFLRDAFDYAKKAECLARCYQFTEMVEWSKANEALCTEELVRSQLFSARKNIQPENSLHE